MTSIRDPYTVLREYGFSDEFIDTVESMFGDEWWRYEVASPKSFAAALAWAGQRERFSQEDIADRMETTPVTIRSAANKIWGDKRYEFKDRVEEARRQHSA